MLPREVWKRIAELANDHPTWLALTRTCKMASDGVFPVIQAYMHEQLYVQFPFMVDNFGWEPGQCVVMLDYVTICTNHAQALVNEQAYGELHRYGRLLVAGCIYGDGKLITFKMRRIDLIRLLSVFKKCL